MILSESAPAWRRYAVAILVAVLILSIRLTFGDTLGRQAPFALLGLGVLGAGWLAGIEGALATTALLCAVSVYIMSAGRVAAIPSEDRFRLLVLVLEGAIISLIVGAINRGRLRQEGVRRQLEASQVQEQAVRRRLEALAQFSAALGRTLTTQEVTKVVVERAALLTRAKFCALYILDASGGLLELSGHTNLTSEMFASLRIVNASPDNPWFRSLRTNQPVWHELAPSASKQHQATLGTDLVRGATLVSVPLTVAGTAIGVLSLGGDAGALRFSDDDRNFVETLAGECAQALRRAQLLTREQQARKAAERAEASLTTTLRSIGDAVIATDRSGKVTFLNAVATQLTGWDSEAARGRELGAVFRVIHEQTRQELQSPVDAALNAGGVASLPEGALLICANTNRETPIDDSIAPIRDESGEIQGAVLVFRDVSERKQRERRRLFLADATSMLAASFEQRTTLQRLTEILVPRFADWCAVDLVNPGHEVPQRLAATHVDPAKALLTQELTAKYPQATDVLGGVRNVLETGLSELYPQITAEMVAALARDAEHARILTALQLRSGLIVPLRAGGRVFGTLSLALTSATRAYNSEDVGLLEELATRAATVIDNSRLYASEHEARVTADIANRTKDEFLATVSHELRTPLNSILGWAWMMAKAPDDEQRRARAVTTIERNAMAMARLIENLLDVSHIMSGKISLNLEAVDLLRAAESTLASLREEIDAKGLNVKLSSTEAHEDLTSLADAARVDQVLSGLLGNAIKFTEKGGAIDITVRKQGASVKVEIQDTGKGIEPGFLQHVFEPFRQVDGSITRAQGGLGLGLAISQILVKQHGGTLEAFSEGPTLGTKFVMALPAREVEHAALPAPEDLQPPASVKSARGRLPGLRVLAVDDDADAREVLRSVLENCGAIVRVAASAADALRAIDEEVPDILLSDIGMPGEDGYALIRKVRALPVGRGGALPAAALTAYTGAEDRRNVLGAGYAAHVPKPVDPAELITVVSRIMDSAQTLAQPPA